MMLFSALTSWYIPSSGASTMMFSSWLSNLLACTRGCGWVLDNGEINRVPFMGESLPGKLRVDLFGFSWDLMGESIRISSYCVSATSALLLSLADGLELFLDALVWYSEREQGDESVSLGKSLSLLWGCPSFADIKRFCFSVSVERRLRVLCCMHIKPDRCYKGRVCFGCVLLWCSICDRILRRAFCNAQVLGLN